jgi:FKBP-type peptidyl-prolyl cis-trans isomerase SlyD
MNRTYLLLALIGLLAVGCGTAGSEDGGESVIEIGSQVKMHYTLTVDGEVVDSSDGKDPLAYTQGTGQIIPGLEEQLAGLKVGDKKACTVSPEKAYGLPNPEAQQTVPLEAFQDSENLKVGDTVSGQVQGQPFAARVMGIEGDQITLDLNHPLAGKILNFDVEIVEIQAPTTPAAPQGS